jgi:hypothetical protein
MLVESKFEDSKLGRSTRANRSKISCMYENVRKLQNSTRLIGGF